MAWAEELPNGQWRACWRDQAGRKRSLSGHRNKPTALRVAGEHEAKNRRGEQTRTGRAPTWGDWCPIWTAGRTVEPSTAEISRLLIGKHLEPHWGGYRLNRIVRPDVQQWVTGLASSGLGPASVEKVFRLFSSSMTAAVRDEAVPVIVNPCTGVKLPPIPPGHERFLTRAEVNLIAEHLNQPYRVAVLLAAGSGMRWGELVGLHWQRVDLAEGTIDIVETWDPTARRIKAYPKGRKRRAVPIAPWVMDALVSARDAAPADTDTCGYEHAAGSAKCRSGLVILGNQGAPLNGKNFGRRDWRTACAAAGIDPPRLHDLRHTYASWLVQAGVQMQEVQRLLGHAAITTTQRYSHLGTSQNERVLAALA